MKTKSVAAPAEPVTTPRRGPEPLGDEVLRTVAGGASSTHGESFRPANSAGVGSL